MRMFRMAAAGVLLGLALGLPGTPAKAAQIYVSAMSLANGYQVVGFERDPTKTAGAWAGGTEYAGQQTLTANYGAADNPAGHFSLLAWCVDVFHNIYLGANSIVYTTGALAVPNAASIAALAVWGNQQLAGGPDALLSAAVQATIWNLEYNMRLVGGSNAALMAKVNYLSNTLLPTLPASDVTSLVAIGPDGRITAQGLITQVPEPEMLTLFAAALVGLAVVRRRRRHPEARSFAGRHQPKA